MTKEIVTSNELLKNKESPFGTSNSARGQILVNTNPQKYEEENLLTNMVSVLFGVHFE
jgi:hypothetical protein